MGLALYDAPSHPLSFPPLGDTGDEDEDGCQGLGFTQHRYLPGHAGPSFHDPANPKAKHARRPFKWDSSIYSGLQYYAQLSSDNGDDDPKSKGWLPHHIQAVQSTPRRLGLHLIGPGPRDREHFRSRANQSKHTHFEDELREASALARDGRIRLPFDRERQRSQRRPPSLERQDAFRDGRTVKRKRLLGEEDVASDAELRAMGLLYDNNDEDAQQDKELRAMGLLYHDEHLRGERFTLETIQRDEPVYAIKTQTKRKSRGRKSQKLDMSLEFSVLGEDEELAAFLAVDTSDELATSLAAGREGELRDAQYACSQTATAGQVQGGSPRLTVIYELVREGEEEEEEDTWDLVIEGEGCNGDDNAAPSMAEVVVEDTEDVGGTKDPWVVLGLDGS